MNILYGRGEVDTTCKNKDCLAWLGGNLNIKLLKQSRKALRSPLPLGDWVVHKQTVLKKHLLYQTHKRIINYVCEHRKSEEICVWQWIRKQTSDICFLGI